MTPAFPALVVRDLHCRFADPPATALAGVSMTASAGELVAIMGESGAGKSTLLRCVNALVPFLVPAECSGEIKLGDLSVLGRGVGELAGRVAMVFQDFEAQLFSTDVRLEVAFGPAQLGVPGREIERRVAAALEMVGLTGCADRDPSTLSGGQKQRLAIASILAMAPAVVLLDEAATDLDPVGRSELYATLQRLRRERLALVAVEHEIDPVMGADRIHLMRKGEMVANGSPGELAREAELFLSCGVRPHDLAVLARRLETELPLDLDGAIEHLRRMGVGPGGRVGEPQAAGAAGAGVAGAAPVLVVERLSHAYDGGPLALSDVSLTIGAGEMIALIGPNGSGKTTLAKHLNGLLRAEEGHVYLAGVDLRGLSLERVAAQVGYVFQNPDHQLFAATVEDEVAFGPLNFGLSGAVLERCVEEALVAVGLAEFRDRDPFLLGKGERQRLAVATVLAMAPRVLILDEPTTGLDYPEQRRVLDLLARLRAGGTTVIVITHSPWVVCEYADRALLMHQGRLVFDGTLARLLGERELLQAAAFEPPPIIRLGRELGIQALRRDEVIAAIAAALV